MKRRGVVVPGVLLVVSAGVVVAGLAMVQPGSGQGRPGGGIPGVQPGQQPGGPGGPGGRPGIDPQQFVDRLMAGDTDGDGKLSRSEVTGPLASRFDSVDGNRDGYLDRAELTTAASAFGGGGRGMRMPLGRAMESVEEALHALQDSAMDASTRVADLERVQAMQEGLLAAKFHAAGIEFDAAVLEHFDGDTAEARLEFREHLIDGLDLALDLEVALMDGDAGAAREVLVQLEELEHHSHEEFRVD